MTTKLSYIYTILSLFLFIQCKQEKAKENIQSQNTSTIKYAKGFDIIEENGNKYLLIKKVFQNEISSFKYLLS